MSRCDEVDEVDEVIAALSPSPIVAAAPEVTDLHPSAVAVLVKMEPRLTTREGQAIYAHPGGWCGQHS